MSAFVRFFKDSLISSIVAIPEILIFLGREGPVKIVPILLYGSRGDAFGARSKARSRSKARPRSAFRPLPLAGPMGRRAVRIAVADRVPHQAAL